MKRNFCRRIIGLLLCVIAPATVRAQDLQLTLEDAVAGALRSYPALAAGSSEVDLATAGVAAARAARLPSVSANAMVTRFEEPMVVTPIHGFDPQNLPEFDRTLAQGGVELTYTLFDAGARGARITEARARRGSAEARLAATRQEIIAATVRAYVRVQTARTVAEAHARQVEAMAAERSRASQLFSEGRAPRVALLRAEAALSAAEAEGHAARANVDVAERDLARVSSMPPADISASAMAELRPREGAMPDRAAVHAQAWAGSAELAALRRQVDAARARHAQARALQLPRVQLAGRYTDYGTLDTDRSGEWNAGVQLAYAVFTGGSRGAALDQADAEERAARAAVALAELRMAGALDAAMAATESAHARARALELAVRQSDEVARIERLALDAGAGTQSEYLRAEAELFRMRAALAEARSAEIAARIEMARISGDLTIEWLTHNLESAQ